MSSTDGTVAAATNGGGKATTAAAAASTPATNMSSAGAGAGAGAGASAATAAPGGAAPDGGGDRPGKAVTFDTDAFHAVLPLGPDTGGNHCHSQLPATTFAVRGKSYLGDKVKIGAQASVAELVHIDLYKSNDMINMATRSDAFVQRAIAAGDTRYFVVVTFSSPGSPRTNMSCVFALPLGGADSVEDKAWKLLWRRFLKGDDKFRNERWKVIPRIAEGSWMVKKAVGTKPALLGQKLTHTWSVTEQYMNVQCDVASSSVASVLVGMLQQYAKYLVIDLAFVVQGNEEEELPERVLGALRISRVNLALAPLLGPDTPKPPAAATAAASATPTSST